MKGNKRMSTIFYTLEPTDAAYEKNPEACKKFNDSFFAVEGTCRRDAVERAKYASKKYGIALKVVKNEDPLNF